MEAAANGLSIQVKKKWVPGDVWTDVKDPAFNWEDRDYRIKPRPSLRPYTWEEFAVALKEHGPAIQLKFKTETWDEAIESVIIPCNFNAEGFNCHYGDSLTTITYKALCGEADLDFRWAADKTPCGVLVAE